MTLDEKYGKSLDLIRQAIGEFKSPAVLWSGGKDSMVMLHLIRHVMEGKHPFPFAVIHHREPIEPDRFAFHEEIKRLWALTVYDYPPHKTGLVAKGDELEVLRYYSAGNKYLILPVSCYEPPAGQVMHCGMTDLMLRPTGVMGFPWDLCFIGHKASDINPIFGPTPVRVDYKFNNGGPTYCFPIRHWTDADIWEFTKREGVPQDWKRYDLRTGKEHEDRQFNSDYYPICTRCFDCRQPTVVTCPKLGRQVENIHAQMPYVSPEAPAYMRED